MTRSSGRPRTGTVPGSVSRVCSCTSTWRAGSSRAPCLLEVRRTPLPTARIRPWRAGEQGDDPVGLAQLLDAQHDRLVTVERHVAHRPTRWWPDPAAARGPRGAGGRRATPAARRRRRARPRATARAGPRPPPRGRRRSRSTGATAPGPTLSPVLIQAIASVSRSGGVTASASPEARDEHRRGGEARRRTAAGASTPTLRHQVEQRRASRPNSDRLVPQPESTAPAPPHRAVEQTRHAAAEREAGEDGAGPGARTRPGRRRRWSRRRRRRASCRRRPGDHDQQPSGARGIAGPGGRRRRWRPRRRARGTARPRRRHQHRDRRRTTRAGRPGSRRRSPRSVPRRR